MKTFTDKELAAYLLETRQQNGRTPSWGKQPQRAVLFFGLLVILSGIGVIAQAWWFCGFLFGYAIGILSRDRAHRRQLMPIWPFYVQVIDWSRVEKIANGEPPA